MKTLFANGDSWTFGTEIAAPEFLAGPGEKGYGMFNRFKKDKNCHDPANDYYRVPRVWPSRLAERLGITNVINQAWPGRSNDTIYNSTMAWVLEHYVTLGKDTSDLIVVVGWTSPERRNVYIEDMNNELYEFVFWPAIPDTDVYKIPEAKKYFEFLVNHLWIERESVTRFVDQNYSLHNFLQLHNIEHYFFNSFYVPKTDGINVVDKWTDINMLEVIAKFNDVRLKGWYEPRHHQWCEAFRLYNAWKMIPESVFMNKSTGRTFKRFIDENIPKNLGWVGMHPSPESHDAWAEQLYQFMVKK